MKRWLTITAAVLGLTVAAVWLACPQPSLIKAHPESRAFFDIRGRLLRLRLAADQRYRLFTSLDHISPQLIEATLIYEDKDFFDHPGVDLPALARAFWTTYITRMRRVGASTITMQVARLRWHIPTNTVGGKLRQILRALQLTRHYSKERILEAYLNLAPYGGNIEGIQAASLIYFNKTADRLTLPEALTLAVVPQNPVQRNPATAEGFQRLQAARQSLYHRWLQAHPQDRQLAAFFERPLAVRAIDRLPFAAPHPVALLDQTASPCLGNHIHTTIDLDRQQAMEAVVKDYIKRRASQGITNAAALALDVRTMAITAMVGSADFFDDRIQGQVNGTTARRSPGSALKPFVYALAMDQGLIHPMSLMKDSPRRFGGFTPENFDQRFLGPLSVHDALILSRNLPAAHLQARLLDPGFHGFLQRAGIGDLKSADFYGLALCLGGVEVTMLELAGLYAALANGGRLQPIRMETNTMDEKPPLQLLSPEASFLILDILKDNPPPDSHRMHLKATRANEVAWKTGTSHGFRDAWAVGVSNHTVMAVWVGNFDGPGNRSFVGRSAAGPLLFDLLVALVPDQGWTVEKSVDISRLNVKRIEACAMTGHLPGRHCPHTLKTWFIPGVSPIRVCQVHRAIPIDTSTGRRACMPMPGRTVSKVFEFWPSDLLAIFRMAGISLREPPLFDADCNVAYQAATGLDPVITSPQPELVYAMRSDDPDKRQIPFIAIADGDVRRLYWFANNRYIDSTPPDQPLIWKPVSGTFDVSVIDDHGRADQTAVTVKWVH